MLQSVRGPIVAPWRQTSQRRIVLWRVSVVVSAITRNIQDYIHPCRGGGIGNRERRGRQLKQIDRHRREKW